MKHIFIANYLVRFTLIIDFPLTLIFYAMDMCLTLRKKTQFLEKFKWS